MPKKIVKKIVPESKAVILKKMSLSEKIKKVIVEPNDFFERIKDERGFMESYKLFVLLTPIGLILNIAVTYLMQNTFDELTLIGYVISLFLIFIIAGFFHIFVKVFGGKKDYSETFKATAYSETPYRLFGWIPYVGPIFGLYSLYLYVKGISKLHNVTFGRSLAMVVVSTIIIFVIVIAMGVLIYFSGMSSTGHFISGFSEIQISKSGRFISTFSRISNIG